MTEPAKGKSGSLFAQPLTPLSVARGMGADSSGLRPSPGLALAALMAVACAAFLIQTRQDGAQNLTATQKKKPASNQVRVAMAERGTETKAAPASGRPSLDFYTHGVRDSMFSAPQPPKVKEAPASKQARVIVPKVNPAFINPFADWSYAGTVTAGDKKMALLENRMSKEGQYVTPGKKFMGAEVKTVTDQMVTVVSAGKPYTFAKSDEIDVTPLSASAAYMTAKTQQTQNDQGQNAQAMAAWQLAQAQLNATGQGMTLPNGRNLSPQQAQRFNNRMNNRFNGPGGGGGGFGGGGFGGGGGRGGRGGRGGQFGPGGQGG